MEKCMTKKFFIYKWMYYFGPMDTDRSLGETSQERGDILPLIFHDCV